MKNKIVLEILEELDRAETLHPDFPKDVIHQVAIMNEESGEAIRAAIQYEYEVGKIDNVRKELIQTAAMCIRAIDNLPPV